MAPRDTATLYPRAQRRALYTVLVQSGLLVSPAGIEQTRAFSLVTVLGVVLAALVGVDAVSALGCSRCILGHSSGSIILKYFFIKYGPLM